MKSRITIFAVLFAASFSLLITSPVSAQHDHDDHGHDNLGGLLEMLVGPSQFDHFDHFDHDNHGHDSAGHRIDSMGHHIDNGGRHSGSVGYYDNGDWEYTDQWYPSQSYPSQVIYPSNPSQSYPVVQMSPSNTGQTVVTNMSSVPNRIPSPAGTGGVAVLSNPVKTGGSVQYTLNDVSYTINPGQSQTIQLNREFIIKFDNGLGKQEVYRLLNSSYEFTVSPEKGWNVVKRPDVMAPVADNPSATLTNAIPNPGLMPPQPN